jgi:site-specific DNA-methyltransferase (adenine-specific)
MLYGLPITELTSMLSRRSVYYSKDADSERYSVVRMGSTEGNIPLVPASHTFKAGSCTQCGAPESLERGETRENYAYPFIHPDQLPKEFKDMKFDVIVGNPPYQISDGGHSASASPIYQKFIEAAIGMDPRYVVMIVPSRWFAGGKGLDKFRTQMLSDSRLSHLVDYVDATECFPGVDIQGGVNYFLWDRAHNGPCTVSSVDKGVTSSATRALDDYDVFIRANDAVSILQKVQAAGDPSIEGIISARKPFGFPTNVAGLSSSEFDGAVTVFYRNRSVGWIDRNEVPAGHEAIDRFKVFLPVSYGERGSGPYFALGKPFTSGPGTACAETYLLCGTFDTESEAENLESYLRTRFVRFLVSLRKNTQHNTRDRFRFVPKLDMNITWTDEMLFERYSLSEDEILFIKSQIKEMP